MNAGCSNDIISSTYDNSSCTLEPYRSKSLIDSYDNDTDCESIEISIESDDGFAKSDSIDDLFNEGNDADGEGNIALLESISITSFRNEVSETETSSIDSNCSRKRNILKFDDDVNETKICRRNIDDLLASFNVIDGFHEVGSISSASNNNFDIDNCLADFIQDVNFWDTFNIMHNEVIV